MFGGGVVEVSLFLVYVCVDVVDDVDYLLVICFYCVVYY